jgi:hypothetical protein
MERLLKMVSLSTLLSWQLLSALMLMLVSSSLPSLSPPPPPLVVVAKLSAEQDQKIAMTTQTEWSGAARVPALLTDTAVHHQVPL